MIHIAINMLLADRAKYTGLLLGIAFTAFLITFAASYFCGFITRGFSLISENPQADIWVMDPAVSSVEQTINMPDHVLSRVRNVTGVDYATPMSIGTLDARFANGRFQTFEVIGVDDVTLAGAPMLKNGGPSLVLHAPDAVIIDPGGTSGKLQTPISPADQWPHDGAHLDVPTRELEVGDELLANENRLLVMGISATLPRFPPRPLIYTSYSNAILILPHESNMLTFVLVNVQEGVDPHQLARRIEAQTRYRARAADDFKEDTVRWYLINSEDVGDMSAMIILAMSVGFGVTGIMLYLFTYEHLKHYAILKVMGATPGVLLASVFTQASLCAIIGSGLGLGLCSIAGQFVNSIGYPFRMMWFTPLVGITGVLLVSITAAMISIRPVLKLSPGIVFAGR